MFKKGVGIISILLGLFLTLSTLWQGFSMLRSLFSTAQQNSAYTAGFIIGQSVGILLFLLAAFFLIKYGLKWLKATKQPTQKEV